jgi:uncharacterized protein
MRMSVFDSDAFNRRLFFPRAEKSSPPPGATDMFIPVDDDVLHVRVHRSEHPTLLLFHGNGEVVSDYDSAAKDFARVGASLAVVDYRGYGQNSGIPSLRNIIEDARVVVDQVRPLIVMGRSLGSACANDLYATNAADAFILESGFTDLDALIERRGMRARADDAFFDPVPKLRKGMKPLLVLHGTEDSIIAPSEAQVAFDNAGTTQKELVWIEGRGHNDISFSPNYWAALKNFVQRVT